MIDMIESKPAASGGGVWELSAADKGRGAVLAALRPAPGWVSGQQLSRTLGLSRNTIWKYIVSLRECGYIIEAAPRRGYRLLSTPDTPFSWEVVQAGTARWLGKVAVYLPETGSTNDVVRELARRGAPAGLCVAADAQTAGRGRRGRSWASPAGRGLCFSLLFRPDLNPAAVPCFALFAASAVATAIRDVTGLPAQVKWPNDVLVHERKVCGILVEMSAETQVVHWLVVGIGINVDVDKAELPPEVRETASSLRMEKGEPVARLPLLHAILAGLEQRYERLLAGDAAGLLAEARQLSGTIGRAVVMLDAGAEPIRGQAVAIAEDGALRVMTSAGEERTFYAGEVSLRVT